MELPFYNYEQKGTKGHPLTRYMVLKVINPNNNITGIKGSGIFYQEESMVDTINDNLPP